MSCWPQLKMLRSVPSSFRPQSQELDPGAQMDLVQEFPSPSCMARRALMMGLPSTPDQLYQIKPFLRAYSAW